LLRCGGCPGAALRMPPRPACLPVLSAGWCCKAEHEFRWAGAWGRTVGAHPVRPDRAGPGCTDHFLFGCTAARDLLTVPRPGSRPCARDLHPVLITTALAAVLGFIASFAFIAYGVTARHPAAVIMGIAAIARGAVRIRHGARTAE
jgi:hypothetical protein